MNDEQINRELRIVYWFTVLFVYFFFWALTIFVLNPVVVVFTAPLMTVFVYGVCYYWKKQVAPTLT
ncbi:MAG: hypothetical protein WC325_13835 [Candidatus Bathyarchaeia archaeon]|jgi:hypothetical protein